jgi:hypothetical protein
MPSQDGSGTNVLIYFKIAHNEFKRREKNHNKPQNNIFSTGYIHMKIQVSWDVTAVDS